jgi:hypothetical protein
MDDSSISNPPEATRLRTAAEAGVVIGCAVAFATTVLGILVLVLTGNHPGGRDFVSYWVAGHAILAHANPYESAAVLAAERSVGFPADAQSLIMRNAPWALPLVMPLGVFGLRAGALVWSLMLVACLLLSVHLLWRMHGSPPGRLQALGYTFGPALACILGGQTALFPLLGLVLFLRWHRERPFAAGAALWLCALKPHLFVPFGVALVLWIVVTRGWRILAGAGTALGLTSAVATALDPGVWHQYAVMMRNAGIANEFIPCLAVALRFSVSRQAMWIEYVPATAACVWAAHLFWQRRASWQWSTDGAVLMLVSVMVAPYAWPTDEAMLIPALLVAVYSGASRAELQVLALGSAAIEAMMLFGATSHSAWFLWTTPFWLGWFLWVRRAVPAASRARQAAWPLQAASL